MAHPTCSLSLLAARTDVSFMMHTIPHLVRMCQYPFVERLLLVDPGRLAGDFSQRPGVGTLKELQRCCDQLLADGVIDRVAEINFSDAYRRRVYQKHLMGIAHETHAYRGSPVLGYMACLEEAKGDYVVYFDSDMLLYQQPGYSWIATGIELMESHPDLLDVLPLAGPPSSAGQRAYPAGKQEWDDAGFYRLKDFTSRKFLIHRQRFDTFLPLTVTWRPSRKRYTWIPYGLKQTWSQLTGRGGLEQWEQMISDRLHQTSYCRADLGTDRAWTLHPKHRGEAFITALPHIIQQVEQGWYPAEQAGDYDLNLPAWLEAIEQENSTNVLIS